VDVLFEGSVVLTDGTFDWDGHDVAFMTPHGALDAASAIAPFGFVTNKYPFLLSLNVLIIISMLSSSINAIRFLLILSKTEYLKRRFL